MTEAIKIIEYDTASEADREALDNLARWATDHFCHPAQGLVCGRCGRVLGGWDEAEMCWWCKGPLCGECWEELGHCGHEEAEQVNERLRELYGRQEEALNAQV